MFLRLPCDTRIDRPSYHDPQLVKQSASSQTALQENQRQPAVGDNVYDSHIFRHRLILRPSLLLHDLFLLIF